MMDTLKLIAGIFTALTLGVIGFAYWDRRTIIRKAKEETLERGQISISKICSSLFAKNNFEVDPSQKGSIRSISREKEDNSDFNV